MARSIQIVAILLLASRLDAAPILINVTDPKADYFARLDTCTSWPVEITKYKNCVNRANLSTDALGEDDALFLDAFTAWNFTNAAASQWVLAYGGELPGGVFNVSKFDTIAGFRRGVVEIQIDWIYTGEDKSTFMWSQAIETNNLPDGTFVDPLFKMDVRTPCNNANLARQCPPLYPSQYADRYFYDRPQRVWPNGFFSAAAFLTKANFETRTLTYYEGVHYAFRLNADEADPGPDPDPDPDPDIPEPSILALALVGAACMRFRKRPAGR